MPHLRARSLSIALVVLLLGLAAPAARADIVKTKSGETIEGKIIESNDRFVKVKTKFAGVKTIPRSDVLSETPTKTKAEIYQEKLAKLPPKDVKAHWALAEWLKKEKSYREYRQQLKKVVSIDPDHAAARKALKHVKFDGQWVKKSELKKLQRAKQKANMKASGRVKYKGKWVTPDEKTKLELGFVQHEGRWLPAYASTFIKKGFQLHEGEWLKPKSIEKRKANLYRVGRKWVDVAEANTFHSDDDTPWKFELVDATLQSTAPWAHINDAKQKAAKACEWLREFGFGHGPKKRFNILVFGAAEGYHQAQTEVQAETMHFAYHSASFGGVYNPALDAATCYKLRPDYDTRYLVHAIGETWYTKSLPENAHRHLWFMLGVGHMLGHEMTSSPLNVSGIRYLISDKLYTPVKELINWDMMKGSDLKPDYAWNKRLLAQSALLIHLLYCDPKFRDTFAKFRRKVCAGEGTPSVTFREMFDVEAVDKALLALLQSGKPLAAPPAAK